MLVGKVLYILWEVTEMKLWVNKDLNVFMDISTYCNAGCPQCHRTNPQGLAKQDWLPLVKWSLEDFVKAFPISEMKNVKRFNFCGTWGDPMMAKDILKIVEYIINNSKSDIIITTNGSLRSDDFWWNIGALGGRRLQVIFDIDGINQEMHEKYRRFTNLDTVLANLTTFSQTKAMAKTQTVLFKHNQDYKDDIRALAISCGSVQHTFVISDRFNADQGNKTLHVDENGQDFILEKADDTILPKGIIAGTHNRTLSNKITCRWGGPRNEVVVNPDGQILPCCYHQNNYYLALNNNIKWLNDFLQTPEYTEYEKNKKQYNIFHTPLSEIIDSKWYSETLPDSMDGDNPLHTCSRNCSSRTNVTHQLREELSA